MPSLLRQLAVTLIAFIVGLAVAGLAIVAIVQDMPISLQSGLPTSAVTTPMLAVVIFWGAARVMSAPLEPLRTFLFGGIAVYSVLYFCGRLVALSYVLDTTAILAGLLVLFIGAFTAIRLSYSRMP